MREPFVSEPSLGELGKKIEARMPGVGRILREMRDSGDPDRLADAAYLIGTLEAMTDYVDLLKRLSGLFAEVDPHA